MVGRPTLRSPARAARALSASLAAALLIAPAGASAQTPPTSLFSAPPAPPQPLTAAQAQSQAQALAALKAEAELAGTTASPASGGDAPTATGALFACSAPGARTCYFALTLPTGQENFSLGPGQSRALPGVVAGRDYYIVTYGAPSFGNAPRCRLLAALGHACIRKIVGAGAND